jgi:hypothetical protein
MKGKFGSVLAVVAVAGAAYLLYRRTLIVPASDVPSGVTASTKGGSENTSGAPTVTTTPIKSGPLGFVKTAVSVAAGAAERTVKLGSSAFQNVRANLFQPFGNPASAASDYSSPSNPAARPSAWADIN